MKKLLLAAIIGLTLISCSNDEQPTKVENPKDIQLEYKLKECVRLKRIYDAQQTDKAPVPPGFDLCDCVKEAEESTKK